MSQVDEFGKVFAELPVWIADTAVSKCGIDKRDSIISKLIKYVVEPHVNKHVEELVKGDEVTISTDPLIEAVMRGWKDLPIKPLSRGEIERALVGIAGTRIIAGKNVRLSYIVKNEERFIMIKLEWRPPPRRQPPPQVGIIEIWEIGNVIIGMGLLSKDRLGDNVKSIDITVETTDGCGLFISKASQDDLEWIIGENPLNEFVNRISPVSPEVKFIKLRIELLMAMEKEEIERLITSLGISEGSFKTG